MALLMATADTMSHRDIKRGPRNVGRNVGRNVKQINSEKPHGPKSSERPLLHAIDTSAVIKKENTVFVVVCAGELKSQVDFVNTPTRQVNIDTWLVLFGASPPHTESAIHRN